jgi:hypothetical protein
MTNPSKTTLVTLLKCYYMWTDEQLDRHGACLQHFVSNEPKRHTNIILDRIHYLHSIYTTYLEFDVLQVTTVDRFVNIFLILTLA